MSKHTAAVISERRQKLWTCLTKGMKGYEIAKELIRRLRDEMASKAVKERDCIYK
jgi:hypothetical protein